MLTVDFGRLGLFPGERLLDLGCGAGRHAYEGLRRGGRVLALDADGQEVAGVAAMLDTLTAEGQAGDGGRASAVCGDALGLPFPDASFDRVIAAEVLEHVGPDRSAMTELARVLRPGGILAVTVPRWLPERVNWASPTSTTTSRAATSGSTADAHSSSGCGGPACATGAVITPTPSTRRTGGSSEPAAWAGTTTAWFGPTTPSSCGT